MKKNDKKPVLVTNIEIVNAIWGLLDRIDKLESEVKKLKKGSE